MTEELVKLNIFNDSTITNLIKILNYFKTESKIIESKVYQSNFSEKINKLLEETFKKKIGYIFTSFEDTYKKYYMDKIKQKTTSSNEEERAAALEIQNTYAEIIKLKTNPEISYQKFESLIADFFDKCETLLGTVNVNIVVNSKKGEPGFISKVNLEVTNYLTYKNLRGDEKPYGFFNKIVGRDEVTFEQNETIYLATLKNNIINIKNSTKPKNLIIFGYGASGSGKTSVLLGDNKIDGMISIVYNAVKENIAQININEYYGLVKVDIAPGHYAISVDKTFKYQYTYINSLDIKENIHNITSNRKNTGIPFQGYNTVKTIKATPLNEESSRSVLEIIIELKNGSKIIFVDLPGSEDPLTFFKKYVETNNAINDYIKEMKPFYPNIITNIIENGTDIPEFKDVVVQKRILEKTKTYEQTCEKTFNDYLGTFKTSTRSLGEVFAPSASYKLMNAINKVTGLVDILKEGFYINETLNQLKNFLRYRQGGEPKMKKSADNDVIGQAHIQSLSSGENEYDTLNTLMYNYKDINTKDVKMSGSFINYLKQNYTDQKTNKFIMFGLIKNFNTSYILNDTLNQNTLEYISGIQLSSEELKKIEESKLAAQPSITKPVLPSGYISPSITTQPSGPGRATPSATPAIPKQATTPRRTSATPR